MFGFENYKNNLELIDKFNIKDVVVDKNVLYRGDLSLVAKQTQEEIKPLPSLAAVVLGLDNTAYPLPKNKSFYNIYTDIDAQELYLSSKPTCYLILGKPGSGAYSLGEALSKKLNCVHLCPKNVITDEIEQKSPTGICIDFNMRHNDVCKVDKILPIMMKKLESDAVKHRGYVISGLPLVTSSKKALYYFNPVYGEESALVIQELLFNIICNLKKKKPKKANDPLATPRTSLSSRELKGEEEAEVEEEEVKEEVVEEEEEIKVELPKFLLDPCSEIIFKKKPYFDTKDTILLQQFQDLMNVNMQPDIIIYITCPDMDLVTKKHHKYINTTNNIMITEPYTSKVDSELRWPAKYTIADYEPPFDTHTFNPKYNCRQPINFEERSVEQMCNYRNIILPFIEKKLNDFDPKLIIKLDALISVHQMIYHVMEKLLLLPVKPVIVPEPLYLEEPLEDIEEFWKSVEDLNVIRNETISFTRYPSPWYNRCPVELKKRKSTIGNPKFAVSFFKHVYLLSSLSAMISFCRNPRPFLQIKYLEPTCRIIVIGSKSSGKTLVSSCLSWLFDTPILCYNHVFASEKEKKYDTFARTILSEIIATIEDVRFAKWQRTEMERYSQLEAWSNFTLETLKSYIPYLVQSFKYIKEEPVIIPEEQIIERKKEDDINGKEEDIMKEKEEENIEVKEEEGLKEKEDESIKEKEDESIKEKEEESIKEIEEGSIKEKEDENITEKEEGNIKKKKKEIIKGKEDVKKKKKVNIHEKEVESTKKEKMDKHREKEKHIKKKEEEYNIEPEDEKQDEPDEEFLQNMNYYTKILYYLPFLDDLEKCEMAINDNALLKEYAPIELITMTEKPAIPALGDIDVTIAISDYILTNELEKELEPTVEELMTAMIRVISDVDAECTEITNSEQMYGKYIIDGFPSDPEYWEYLNDAKLLPDCTIALIENREIDAELMAYYAKVEKVFKNYQEKFILANDPLIKTKLQISGAPETKVIDIEQILHETVYYRLDQILSKDVPPSTDDTGNSVDADLLASFTASVEKFREDWDSVKLKLDESSIFFIEVELENKTEVNIVEEILLNLRKGYFLVCEVNEDEVVEDIDDEENTPRDFLTHNDPRFLCETNIYCPIAYYDHGVLWEGKPEFSVKYNNKIHYFSKEEFTEIFQSDVTKYQSYNKPYKKLPALRICVIGCIGSGKSTVSQIIAKELGLVYIDFSEIINEYLMPKHFKKFGRRYENSFTDIPIDDEAVSEFQMGEENENLISEIISNENEFRLMVYNYFERGSPIISILMQRLITRLWFQNPFLSTGFVLDGYPRLSNDVEDMMACFCIPDLILELEGSAESTLNRLSPAMMKTWKLQLNEAKKQAKMKLDNDRMEWMNFITKTVVSKLIFDDIINNIPIENDEPDEPNEPAKGPSTESVIIDSHPSGSTNIDTNLFNTYNELIEQYPEPVDLTEWEKTEDARERIDARIESIYETDDENIQSLKEILSEQRIRVISVDGTKPVNKLIRIILLKLLDLNNRNESFLEQTYLINTDIAEMLLLEGFYFLSKFNRMCPVYIYENTQTIHNNYKISKRKGKIFTVVHRSYIYFIGSEENARKFRNNPLQYIDSNVITNFLVYPIRISIIGAPKSGRSTLAKKLARRYGLICISRGKAVRNVLENMQWTELASRILKALENGEKIDYNLITKAIKTVMIDHRSNTYGCVFDGFPEFPMEAMELDREGLYPTIVFCILSDKDKVVRNSQLEVYNNILKYKPPYSVPFIEDRYLVWKRNNSAIKNWINNDYQNLYVLNGDESQWQCLQNANDIITNISKKTNYYIVNVKTNIVPADVMCISSEIFQHRMSDFKDMCPLCLQKNVLKHSGYPVDRKGVVQYKNLFYWICEDHKAMVLKHPHSYLTTQPVKIPEIPAVVKTINMSLVYEKGICIVTYADHLPSQRIERGNNQYAASFHKKTYLFCTEKCLKKFLEKPHMYHDIVIFKQAKEFPVMSLKKMPNLGYLEQTLGNIITDACCSVNVLRPKYPGLDYSLSALLYIALYLKTHNPVVKKSVWNEYKKAFDIYEARCKLIFDVGLRLRSMDNPFANYPKCCHPRKYLSSLTVQKPSSFAAAFLGSSVVTSELNVESRRVPVPDERFDYLCEFHKPVSKVPAFLNVVDIAGLVRGAAEGQGLGNAFLSHIKACDAIFNLCRAFDDEDVIHVDGDVNPVRDLETIGEELRLKDEEQLIQNVEKLDRVVNRGNDKKLKPEYETLMKIKTILVDEKKHIRFGDWSAADIEVLNKYLFLTSKPALYLVNLSEKDYTRKKNKWLPKLKEWIDKNDPGAPLIPFSGVLESKLLEMDPTERQAYLKEHNITSALDKIIVQGYKALQLEYFFTAGPDEVKAWTIQKGTKAPQAAGRIHTDFEKGFIMAEVMHFKDFKEEGTEAACKAAGKYRQQGRNYVVEDGDVIFFKFNAGAGLKDAKKK